MSAQYLYFQIFGMALTDMASSSGSISNRFYIAYVCYLYKVEWERDLLLIPEDFKDDFLQLKKIVYDEVLIDITKGRKAARKEYESFGMKVTDVMLSDRCNARTVIRGFHWQKAKRATELMKSIYFGLGLELHNR